MGLHLAHQLQGLAGTTEAHEAVGEGTLIDPLVRMVRAGELLREVEDPAQGRHGLLVAAALLQMYADIEERADPLGRLQATVALAQGDGLVPCIARSETVAAGKIDHAEVHSPRWFDQTTSLPPPPLVGYYTYVPESVYHYVSGAGCYYTDANFPEGAHRRPEYDPPGAEIPHWNSLPHCGVESQWAGFGNVSVHSVRHIIPGGGNF